MNIELTMEQVKNLEVFLSRAEMKGSEAVAYVEITNAIGRAKDKSQEEKGD